MQVVKSRTTEKRRSWADRLVTAGATASGIVLALAPVALWIAWSPAVFLIVVAGIAACTGVFLLLERCDRSSAGDRPADLNMDEFIAEIHAIFPLTYHHSMRGRSRFRRAMDKLRRLAY